MYICGLELCRFLNSAKRISRCANRIASNRLYIYFDNKYIHNQVNFEKIPVKYYVVENVFCHIVYMFEWFMQKKCLTLRNNKSLQNREPLNEYRSIKWWFLYAHISKMTLTLPEVTYIASFDANTNREFNNIHVLYVLYSSFGW